MRAARFAPRAWLARAENASVRVEVMSHLGVVMALALLVLVAAAHRHHEMTLRDVLGPALLAESRDSGPFGHQVAAGTEWWRVSADGVAEPLGLSRTPPDARVLAAAEAARARGAALLDLGAIWDRIVFAAPSDVAGEVRVARLPQETTTRLRTRPAAVFAALALADAAVFGAFGFVLLRRRVVAPFEALAALAREIGEAGSAGSAVTGQVAGPPEARAVADALSEMSGALAGRTKQLSDAVRSLREANEQLRRTHAGLERAERLAAVGRLAAGVAHEVGNPLGAILAFAELVQRDPGIAPTSRTQLDRLLREGERVRKILRQLLDLSRPVRAERRPLDLGRVAEEAVALVSAQRRYAGIKWTMEAAPGAARALGDEGAANQVLLNLLLNAAEAVEGAPARRILVRVQPWAARRRAGDAEGSIPPRARPDAVECLIADTGSGVAEEDRERIFDPFFTTRPAGEGTGLGLPNALRMAEEQGGELELVEPPAGWRTAFAFRLPAANAVSDARTR
ncbi:MAG TPA: ATP-binding protein [Myxococcota bacterium]|nr:ATP-binding protein [Myxococcota bacterium]